MQDVGLRSSHATARVGWGTNLWAPYLDVIVPVVVQVEDPVDLRICAYMQVVGVLHTFWYRLPGILFHLDVVELSVEEQHCKINITVCSISYIY